MRTTRLQTRFFLCYFCAVFIPIMLLSSILYYNHNAQQNRDLINDKKISLITEQSYLENQLDSCRNYYNQLKSNYELMLLINGFYNSEREIVYSYNRQIYSLLSGIYLYDANLNGIRIYTHNAGLFNILKPFQPLSSLDLSEKQYLQLTDGFWHADEETDGTYSFYISFANALMTNSLSVAEFNYNFNIFDAYASNLSDSSIYVYLNDRLVHQCNPKQYSSEYLKQYEQLILSAPDDSVRMYNNGLCIISSIPLQDGAFRIIKVEPVSTGTLFHRSFILNALISGLILIIASILMFLLIFKPFKNIVKLSEHINQQNTHLLAPYTGKITKDETGDLIRDFNQMTKRINDLSNSLLNHEIQLKNAQIEALQAQLNPHFFYGTLESIRMIAEANHQELISEITCAFGSLMRYSLSREYLVPVNREIAITRQYLSIQEKRLMNRFDIEWSICEIDEKWRCPKFVLFSMIENVFSHNVSKSREMIHIRVSIQIEGDDMIFTVINTGPGVSPKRLNELHRMLSHLDERDFLVSENNGRSLFNISDRLKLFYGDNYRFTIESEENVSTTCSVRIHKYFNGTKV